MRTSGRSRNGKSGGKWLSLDDLLDTVQVEVGVGWYLRIHHGDIARVHVVADEGEVWRLDSGCIARKATAHVKWEWL